jgi:hypothetical protein
MDDRKLALNSSIVKNKAVGGSIRRLGSFPTLSAMKGAVQTPTPDVAYQPTKAN